MATMSIMPSPHASHPHSPLNRSPAQSPNLRPKNGPSQLKPAPIISIGPSASLSTSLPPSIPTPPLSTSSSSPRSYGRAPTQRPYAPLLSSRSSPRGATRELEGDTKVFAELVAQLVVARTSKRGRRASKGHDDHSGTRSGSSSGVRGKSPGGSLATSFDSERAELLVDVPVWSPGCFQDLSTLHSLRDRTLSHVHALISHLIASHSIPASYHLLARSALASPSSSPTTKRPALPKPRGATSSNNRAPSGGGWGCIRLAPSIVSPTIGKIELRPKVRRSSMDFSESALATLPGQRKGSISRQTPPVVQSRSTGTSPQKSVNPLSASLSTGSVISLGPPIGLETITARQPLGAGACADSDVVPINLNEIRKDIGENGETVLLETDDAVLIESAIADDDEEEVVNLKSGYTSGTVSDEEDEDADEVVMKEIEKRGAKEGTIFLMTLFGNPALILV